MDELQITIGFVKLVASVTGAVVVVVVSALLYVNRMLDQRFTALGKKIDNDFSKMDTRVAAVDARAGLAIQQVSDLRTEIAREYVTKDGFNQQFGRFREDILSRLDDVKDSVRALPQNLSEMWRALNRET